MALGRPSRLKGCSQQLRRRASSLTFLCVIVVLLLVVSLLAAESDRPERRLQQYPQDGILKEPYGEDPNRWLVVFHIIGIGYMLLGLNTVCDVYFTGALQVMVKEWKIQADVAGATFMAAGGSAPELFTAMVAANVAENDVGFGTIIGSAVFNVLFVIGLCGYVAKTPIALSWWPLFRDCTYYIFGLSLLAWCASDERIDFLEAAVLFVAYVVYCTIMYFNERLEGMTDSEFQRAKKCQQVAGSEDEERPATTHNNWTEDPTPPTSIVPSSPGPSPPGDEEPCALVDRNSGNSGNSGNRNSGNSGNSGSGNGSVSPSTYGQAWQLWQRSVSPTSGNSGSGNGQAPAKQGEDRGERQDSRRSHRHSRCDSRHSRRSSNSHRISNSEGDLAELQNASEVSLSSRNIRGSSKTRRNTLIMQASQDRHKERLKSLTQQSTPDAHQPQPLCEASLGSSRESHRSSIASAVGDKAGQAFDDFKITPIASNRNCDKESDKQEPCDAPTEGTTDKPPDDNDNADSCEDDEPGLMEMPEGKWDRILWIASLPIYAPLYYLTAEPTKRLFLITFFQSLLWIAGLTFFLVWWVDILGQVVGIEPIFMSFTLLAAGTSIPDAVSSMSVARDGEGDMAVSSSIGSNIFDILVGLPVPWMIKIARSGMDSHATIKSPFLTFHTLLLLSMVFMVVLCIHLLKWKLNRLLGACMAVLYVVFLITVLTVEKSEPEWLKF